MEKQNIRESVKMLSNSLEALKYTKTSINSKLIEENEYNQYDEYSAFKVYKMVEGNCQQLALWFTIQRFADVATSKGLPRCTCGVVLARCRTK